MPCPSPKADESHAEFVRRAHAALKTEIPDAEDRSLKVISAWRKARESSDVERAPVKKYGQSSEWHRIEFVPVFKEHEYPRVSRSADGQAVLDDDGNPLVETEKYDLGALASIVENMNHRIADTGDFAPVCDKHTPRPGSAEGKPSIVGFAGPFYLGQIGNRTPRWAIYALEHWYAEKAHLARELPRRSAEVYLGRPINDRVLDPIAALGADTPALDMGIHYSEHNGELVAKYSGIPLLARYSAAAAPAAPGAANVALPEVVGRRAQYDDDTTPNVDTDDPDPQTEPEEAPVAVTPEDINMIVQALMQTEPMQFVLSQMQQQQAAGADMLGGNEDGMGGPGGDVGGMSADDGMGAPGGMPPGGDVGGMPPEMPGAGAPGGMGAPAPGPSDGDFGGAPEPDGDERTGRYSQQAWGLREENRDLRAQYSRLEAELQEVRQQQKTLADAARNRTREAQLQAMRLRGYPIDLTDEIQRCSAATMTDGQFEEHLDTIARYSQPARIPVGVSLPIDDDAALPPSVRSNGEPAFASTREFNQAVQKAAYAQQQQPTYSPSDTGFYSRVRSQVMEEWQKKQKQTGRPA